MFWAEIAALGYDCIVLFFPMTAHDFTVAHFICISALTGSNAL
jgi:hypothetical protein